MPLQRKGEEKKVEPILIEYLQWIEEILEEQEAGAKEAKTEKEDDEQS